jgi:hypothetical protein
VAGLLVFSAHRPVPVGSGLHPSFNAALYALDVLNPAPALGQASEFDPQSHRLELQEIWAVPTVPARTTADGCWWWRGKAKVYCTSMPCHSEGLEDTQQLGLRLEYRGLRYAGITPCNLPSIWKLRRAEILGVSRPLWLAGVLMSEN